MKSTERNLNNIYLELTLLLDVWYLSQNTHCNAILYLMMPTHTFFSLADLIFFVTNCVVFCISLLFQSIMSDRTTGQSN